MKIGNYKTSYEFTPLGKLAIIILILVLIVALADYIRSFIQNYKLNKLKMKKEEIEIRNLERRNYK